MLPVLAEAIASIAIRAVQSLLPNTPADKLELLRIEIQRETLDNDLLKGQLAVNAAEATNDNLFVSGWRPSVGWICAIGFAWQFVLQPVIVFLGSVVHYNIPVPVFDTTTMISALFGMLGIGAMRSYDKQSNKK